jgi:hypothetical protein
MDFVVLEEESELPTAAGLANDLAAGAIPLGSKEDPEEQLAVGSAD